MMKNYEETIEKLKKYNQNEIVNIMSKVYTEEENKKLIEQLNRIDLNQVMNLYKNANNIPLIDERKIEHIEYTDLNSLSEENQSKIIKTYENKSEISNYSIKVGAEIIRKNDYNLNIKKYLKSLKKEKSQKNHRKKKGRKGEK